MPHIGFRVLKGQVTIEAVADLLNLEVKPKGDQYRGPCPACESGGDRALVITPEKGVAYCFAEKKGGDLIWLASHVLGKGVREAALEIAERMDVLPQDGSPTVPQKSQEEARKPPNGHLREGLEKVKERLKYECPAVQDLGLSAEDATRIGIGWSSKGTFKDALVFPMRLPDGTLTGYLAYKPDEGTLKLPPKGLLL